EEAGDRGAALEHASAAARQAVALSAHREAVEQYARALRNAESLPPEHRALLLEAHAYECSLTEQIASATDSRRAALAIWRQLGNRVKTGENLRWLSRLYWFAARNDDAARAGFEALEVLESAPPGPQLAWAYSNVSHMRMLENAADEAIAWGERAIALAEQLGENEVLVHALNNVGCARLDAGDE